MQEWGGAEETATDGDRAAGKHGDGLRGLQETTRGGTKFQVRGADNDGGGRRLASGGRKPDEGSEEPGMAETDIEQGRGGQENIREFFKAVVQQVLLFGVETWVLTPKIERELDLFMHGAARRITGRQPRRGWDGKLYYPSLVGAMKEAVFK